MAELWISGESMAILILQLVLGVLFTGYGVLEFANWTADSSVNFDRALAISFVGFGLLFVRSKWQRSRVEVLPNEEVRTVVEAFRRLPWGGVFLHSAAIVTVLSERVLVSRLDLDHALKIYGLIFAGVFLFLILRVWMILRTGIPPSQSEADN